MNDDTLILYYYGDGLADDERAAVEAALASDASVAERYRALCRSLDGLGAFPAARASTEAVARWHRSISGTAAAERTASARSGRTWRFDSFASGALAAGLAALVAVAVVVAVRPPAPPPVAGRNDIGPAAGIAAAPASFTRGVEVHLQQARHDLARPAPHDDEDRAAVIRDIVRQNRLLERTAEAHNADDVARLLRALDVVLLRLASGDLSDAEAAALRAKLQFELTVMLTRMRRDDSRQAELI